MKRKAEVPLIDRRIHYVGASTLRKMNSPFLRALGEEVYVIQGKQKEPLQVLVSYEHFLKIQEMLLGAGNRKIGEG